MFHPHSLHFMFALGNCNIQKKDHVHTDLPLFPEIVGGVLVLILKTSMPHFSSEYCEKSPQWFKSYRKGTHLYTHDKETYFGKDYRWGYRTSSLRFVC